MAGLVKPTVLVLCGPTATGKTSLAIAAAQRFNGEIISADSMQIYEKLDIGTAKATAEERAAAVHHLVDFLPPEKIFSVAVYVKAADACIRDITARGKLPIVAGGTGLYISSLCSGVQFAPQKTDETVRAQLMAEYEQYGIEPLLARLAAVDPAYAAELHPNNVKRILRALELYTQTGKTMSQQLAESLPTEKPYDEHIFILNCTERSELYARIEQRIDLMLQQGLLDEARLVYENRAAYKTAAQAIGYKEFFPYFEGKASLEECTALLKQSSRRYAKRQLTWFGRMENTTLLAVGDAQNLAKITADLSKR